MPEAPLMLLVNPGPDILPAVDDALKVVFGGEFVVSRYSRPDVHPRLRSYGPDQFTAVLLDLKPLSQGRSPHELFNLRLPDWLEEDLLRRAGRALVIALVPKDFIGAVQAVFENSAAESRYRVVPRELAMADFAEAIRGCWDAWDPPETVGEVIARWVRP